MERATDFLPGNYRFLPSVFQYSAGVAALPGYEIQRIRLRAPKPLEQGFDLVEQFISGAGRPLTAFCACELRSPAPFTEQGFTAFNRIYVERLTKWGLFRDEINPVARSNVCPTVKPPEEPSLYAFCFTNLAPDAPPSFAISGGAEALEGPGSYAERIVRRGDLSPEALWEKARFVLGQMERRLAALGFNWPDTTATQVYTVHDIHPFLQGEIFRRGAAPAGLTWHLARPPVRELEYEMDCRGVRIELAI